jgi:hypothetical protein
MAERLIVVDKERLDYQGLFEAKALFDVMKQWASDKGYWLIEKRHSESTKPEGKVIDFDLEPFRKFTDYAKSIIKIRMQYSEVKDVVVEKDGAKVKMQEGKILMIFDGILETDYEHRWEGKPVFYVLRAVFEKYLYTPFVSGFERGIREDVMALKNNLKAFLNLTKYA